MTAAPEQLRWIVAARAHPGDPGAAVVSVLARNALIPELAFDMAVDWHPGAEAPDVEGRALVILSLLFKELAAECERAAGERFAQG
ncbi:MULTISPECIES: hypothetical protein [unclassified Phenylobacterium]|uniref:hypothetical protein n=1 Tax=unclassified Phenylobacterium TaxID=2640670 RepID=UPI000839E66F|nr:MULTISPECIES: hypothetical protein [unclassified Phenylobacterium]